MVENNTSLLPSVLLWVCSTSSQRQKTSDVFFWYSLVLWWYFYHTNLWFLLHLQTQCTWLVVPDTDFRVTCSTDTDSLGKIYGLSTRHIMVILKKYIYLIVITKVCALTTAIQISYPFYVKVFVSSHTLCWVTHCWSTSVLIKHITVAE